MRKRSQRALTFCSRLRGIREARGLSLAEAEKLCKIPKSTISKLESGKLINPTLRTLLLGRKLYGFAIEDWADLLLLDDEQVSTTSIHLLEEVLSAYETDLQARSAPSAGAGLRGAIEKVREFVVERDKALANPLTPSEARKLSLEFAVQWLENVAESEDSTARNYARRLLERLAYRAEKEFADVD